MYYLFYIMHGISINIKLFSLLYLCKIFPESEILSVSAVYQLFFLWFSSKMKHARSMDNLAVSPCSLARSLVNVLVSPHKYATNRTLAPPLKASNKNLNIPVTELSNSDVVRIFHNI